MNIKQLFLLSATAFAFVLPLNQVSATTSVQKVIDETYVQPEYVLGYSLDESQKNQTLGLLGYDATTDTKPIKTMTPDIYSSIMDTANDPSLQLYSSVKIQKTGSKNALEVHIVTPQQITKVTQDMYRNAAVTLGVEHANITVASPITVTGESALAGIYYSLEENGASVSQETKNLAQEELQTLSDINAENTGKEGYDENKLNVALTDIKSAVAQVKQKNDNLTEDDVRKIVEETLANYNLKTVLSANQINLIINFAVNLSNSGVISNADFIKTLTNLKDSIVSQAESSFKNINLQFDANQALQDGGNFLTNIWNAIVNFFNSFLS